MTEDMKDQASPVVRQQMLIRVTVQRAFEAFVDPAVTTRFWFTHSDGPLKAGSEVCWEWRMYGASASVQVKEIDPNRRIVIHWGQGPDQSTVQWDFESRADDSTLVTISNDGFGGGIEQATAKAIDAMGGFSFVLAGAKAFLEHGIELNLIHDHAPDAHVD